MSEKTDLSRYQKLGYKPGASWLKRGLWLFISALFFNTGLFPSSGLKVFLLRIFGAKIGSDTVIRQNINIKYPWHLILGDYVWIGEQVWIDNHVSVKIGSHVCLSQGAMLMTGNHDYTKPGFDLMVSPIVLEDGVWIGAKAIVCPGLVVQSHAVLTAGSVATKNLEAYSIYQGNPAQKVKDRVIC